MKTYHVTYHFTANGVTADNDFGLVRALNADAAKDAVTTQQAAREDRTWFRRCLTATEVAGMDLHRAKFGLKASFPILALTVAQRYVLCTTEAARAVGVTIGLDSTVMVTGLKKLLETVHETVPLDLAKLSALDDEPFCLALNELMEHTSAHGLLVKGYRPEFAA